MVAVRIYVEGGGQHGKRRGLKPECRRGFREFLRKAGFEGRMPSIIACGSRNDAFEDFLTAQRQGKFALLLVDSEEGLRSGSPLKHLELRDGWVFEDETDEERIHLMVQCMENWFLGDTEALAAFFGQGFRPNALPGRQNVEEVSKADVLASLDQATRATKKKGIYGKGAHSFKILATLDPNKIRRVAPHVDRLLAYLNHALSAEG